MARATSICDANLSPHSEPETENASCTAAKQAAHIQPASPVLPPALPHTETKAVTPQTYMLRAVQEWLVAGNRAWNARQIAQEVSVRYGVSRSPAHWRRLLRRQNLTYKRTKRTLRHKQDPQAVTAKTAEIARLKKGPQADE